MALLDDIYARGYHEARAQCTADLASILAARDENGEQFPPPTEETIEDIARPDEDGGWGGFLTADDHSWEVLNCEPFTDEWRERSDAYGAGAEQGAADWVHLQIIELDARTVETSVRAESPETETMPREIMADWLDDRDDLRAAILRHAITPPDLGPEPNRM